MAKAKAKTKPTRLPLPLSFVEGDSFIRCLTTGEMRQIRDRYVDSDGDVINQSAYLDGLSEALVIDEDGAAVFTDGEVAGLFDPWREELLRRVLEVYSPAPKGGSTPATISQAS